MSGGEDATKSLANSAHVALALAIDMPRLARSVGGLARGVVQNLIKNTSFRNGRCVPVLS